MDNQQETAKEVSKPMEEKYLKSYLLGFTDAEGCFSISLKKEDTARFGWALDPLFQITQHKNNRAVLELFQAQLKCGRIIEKSGQPDLMVYLVDNRRQLVEKIIPFFQQNKLLGKNEDFLKFKKIIEGMESKMHHEKESFIELIKKCYEMNLGGKQRRYKLREVLEDLKMRDPQRLYAKHEAER